MKETSIIGGLTKCSIGFPYRLKCQICDSLIQAMFATNAGDIKNIFACQKILGFSIPPKSNCPPNTLCPRMHLDNRVFEKAARLSQDGGDGPAVR